jgi:asparaginyl-tRNA synthetase
LRTGGWEPRFRCREIPDTTKKQSLDFLRENAHLRVRTNMFGAIITLCIIVCGSQLFSGERFICEYAITGSDAEGAEMKCLSLPFDGTPRTEDGKVNYKEDFFGRDKITVSGQLEGETLHGFGPDLYFGPTFRAKTQILLTLQNLDD